MSHRTSEKGQMICAVARTAQAGLTVTETRTEELPRQWMRLAGETSRACVPPADQNPFPRCSNPR